MKNSLMITIIFVFTAILNGGTLNPKGLVKNWEKMTRLPGSEGQSTLIIFDGKGKKRVRMLASVSKSYGDGETEKKLIRFLAPSEVKGTGFLTYDYEIKDDDRWLYMPALRKTRRIISSEKSKNFMGSEFSYGEMSYPYIEDFKYKLLKVEKVKGVDCNVVEIIPQNEDIMDDYGFSKKISYYSVKDNILKKSIYHDLDGSLHRELDVKSVKLLDKEKNLYKIMEMVMDNRHNGRRSVLKIDKVVLNYGVKDDYFTSRYLERY